MDQIETVIIGGGQAGLATSYYLAQFGHEHIVLEQAAQPINTWRNERWDSFTLVTPNWTLNMPGAAYDGPDRDGFLPRDAIVAYFDRYVEQFHLPIETNTRVLAVESVASGGFRVQTNERVFQTCNVVLATGQEQTPKVPWFAASMPPGITQLPSSRYRNPASLPPGAVLIVGSGQSGCQIAEELYLHGRQVFLSTGRSSGRAPRRYRGKDVIGWLALAGFLDITPDRLPVPRMRFAAPHISGGNGGHMLNLHQFARDGVTLLGHLQGGGNGKIKLAPDLHENLAHMDGFERNIQKMIDDYIEAHGLDAPHEDLPQPRDGFAQSQIEELDLVAAGISTVIWAIGFTADYSLVKLPVCDADGFPIQTCGVTPYRGLYFVGMMWMPSLKTGMLIGVSESAEHIATQIVEHSSRSTARRPAAVVSAA